MFFKRIIKYIKLLILMIINFLSTIFRTPLNNSKKKSNTENINQKKNKIETKNVDTSSLPDTNKTNSEFTSDINYQLLFIEVVEEITQNKFKNLDNNTKKDLKKLEKEILPKIKDKKIINKDEVKTEIKKELIQKINSKNNTKDEIKKNNNFFSQNKNEEKENHQRINDEPLNLKPEKTIITSDNLIKNNTPQIHSIIEEKINKKIEITASINQKDKVIEIKEVQIEYLEVTKEKEQITDRKDEITPPTLPTQKQEEIKEQKNIQDKDKNKDKDTTQITTDLSPYINKLTKMTEEIISKINQELNENELDEEKYENLSSLVTNGINKIEEFKSLNNLNEKEINLLNNNIKKLEESKLKIQSNKTKEMEKHNKELNEIITEEEKNKVNELLIKMHEDYKNDLLELNLNNIEDLNNKTTEEIKLIEKRLLMIKLNKALKCAEIPSILALPFIRNKYFGFFTAGLFIHNHLNDLNMFMRRKEKSFSPVNMEHIVTGTNAIDNSLSITEDNLNNLENIKNEYLLKYPELKDNQEFLNTFNRLENKLISNYNILVTKKNRFNKTKNKATKINKKLNNKILMKTRKV